MDDAARMWWRTIALAAGIGGFNEQTVWMAVAVGGTLVLYFLMKPRKKKDPLAGGPSFPLARQRAVEEQMSNLLVELSEMARRITAQLDTRAAKLDLLIKEADEKIAVLRKLEAVTPLRAVEETGARPPTAASAAIDSAEHEALSDARPTATPHAEPSPAPVAVATVDPRHAQVYALADEGRSAGEIARALGRPAGEVELILALRVR
jgi:hypothetical protein